MMAETSTDNIIKSSRFFRQLPDEHLESVAKLSRLVELPAQTTIFEEYDRAKDVYVIISGEASLVICEPTTTCRQIAVVGEGDLVGWSPIVGRSRLSDTAVTTTPVKALVFDGKELMEYCEKNPAFGFEFMKLAASTLANRLSGTRLQLLNLCGTNFPVFESQIESD